MLALTKEQLHILQHTLGCDQYGRGTMYRNHFVTDETCDNGVICLQLVSHGLMVNRGSLGELSGGSSVFHVTNHGKDVMLSQSPSPPKRSRSEHRYLDWLRADTGLSFADWIGVKPKKKERVM